MNELHRYVLDTIRSMVRVGFLTGVLYVTVNSFDADEAKIIAGYAAAEVGIRSVDWFKKNKGGE